MSEHQQRPTKIRRQRVETAQQAQNVTDWARRQIEEAARKRPSRYKPRTIR